VKVLKVTCDGCGRDLSSTGNSDDKRIMMCMEFIPNPGPTSTALAVADPLPQSPCHFCSLECLKVWMKDK